MTIQSVRENGMDLTGWLEFFAHGLAIQLDEVKHHGERVIRADLMARSHGLNKRQAVTLERFLEVGSLSMADVAALHPRVHRRSLRRDLEALVERGLVKAEGAAMATRHVFQNQ